MKEYEFEVNFTVKILANTYEEAVRKADKKYPDINGVTKFSPKTDEYGFYPTCKTIHMTESEYTW